MRIPAEHRKNYHITSNYPTTTDARRALEENSKEHPDWIVITSFYQALHWVDAFLYTKGHFPFSHAQRKCYIEKTEELEEIKENYRHLKKASEMARYEKGTFRNKSAKVDELLEMSCLTIKHIKTLMHIE